MDISRLVELNNDPKEFFGIFNHNNSIYRMFLKLTEYPSMKNAHINILKDLTHFPFEHEESDDISAFFNKFCAAANSCCEGALESDEITLQRKRDDILNELSILSRQDTVYDILIAPDLSAIRFYDPIHFLKLSITKDLNVIVSDHSLPDQHKWFQSTGSVSNYLNEFMRSLEQLEEFYSNINTIDELCFVVDPTTPTTKNNYRILKIDEKCFAKLVMDPLLPSSINVTFIGPTLQVEHYRNKYEQEISNYDHDLDVHKNLLKICGMAFFPMKHEDDDMLSCSICGMFRIDNSIPMVTCDNSKCDLLFHVGCLRQWWSMFSDGKTFLNIELGTKCPMCKEKLSASFEQLIIDHKN